MQFAERYATEEEVSTAVDTLKSWTVVRDSFAKPKAQPLSEPSPVSDLQDKIRRRDLREIPVRHRRG